MEIPVFVNCRDRLAPLRDLVAWLERAGHEEIYLLDNDSAYEPLLDWYRRTPHTVVRLGGNFGHRSLWLAPGVFELTRGRPFVYSDPDVVPVDECPLDAVDRFSELLERYRLPVKAGFGLVVDDLPVHYRHRQAVVDLESAMYDWPLEPGAYWFPIDTTFALYRAHAGPGREAIRTGPPYVARHASWYLDVDAPTEEEAFYLARASESTHWTRQELDAYHAGKAALRDRMRPGTVTRLRWRLRGRRVVRRGLREQPAA